MMNLTATTDTIEVKLNAAHTTTSLKCVATWRDLGATTFPGGRTVGVTNGVTAVAMVPAPAASTQRIIDFLSVHNADTVAHTVTVTYDAATVEYPLVVVVLAPGETLTYSPGTPPWSTYDTTGRVRTVDTVGSPPVSSGWTTVVLGADVANANATANTIADITGLSFAVTAGQRYVFKLLVFYTAAATATGSRFSISGPAAPTELYYRSQYSLTATTVTTNEGLAAYDLPAASNATSAATAANVASIEGLIIPSATGTLIARFASEVLSSAITAKRGSILQWLAV